MQLLSCEREEEDVRLLWLDLDDDRESLSPPPIPSLRLQQLLSLLLFVFFQND